jgi:hypothetical protein
MNWLLISALGFAAWLSVLLWLVAMCRVAARPDEIAAAPVIAMSGSGSPATSSSDGAVIDLGAFRSRRSVLPQCPAGAAKPAASA